MPVAVNDAGDILTLGDDGQWKPATMAQNPQTGTSLYLDGKDWKPVTDLKASMRSTGETVSRAVSQPAQGFNESLATTVGALPDLIGAGMRGIGIPNSPAPGQYTDIARRGIHAVTSLGGLLSDPPKAETTIEKALYGLGTGIGDAASVALPAAVVANASRAGGVVNGVAQALASQPVAQLAAGGIGGAVGEATDNPYAGLAASVVAPMAMGAVGRAIRPIRPDMDPERQRLIAAALHENIPLSAAQRTGSTPLKYLEGTFETLPITGGVEAALRREQQTAINTAVMARTGQVANNAAPDTLNATRARIGGVFNDVSGRNTLNVTDDVRAGLRNLQQEMQTLYTNDQARPVVARIQQVLQHEGGDTLPGAFYRRMDSELGSQIRNTNDGITRDGLTRLRQTLREAMDASISPADSEAWNTARRQYANYAVVRDAMSGAGEAAATGNIPPLQIQAALKRSVGRGGYSEGRGDLNDLSRVAQAMLRPAPNSWTAGRQMMINLLTGGGIGTAAASGGMVPAAVTAAMALGGPRAVQAAYHSNAIQNYLINGIPGLAPLADNAPRLNRELAAALTAQHLREALPGR
jgi:hypothetical protein